MGKCFSMNNHLLWAKQNNEREEVLYRSQMFLKGLKMVTNGAFFSMGVQESVCVFVYISRSRCEQKMELKSLWIFKAFDRVES